MISKNSAECAAELLRTGYCLPALSAQTHTAGLSSNHSPDTREIAGDPTTSRTTFSLELLGCLGLNPEGTLLLTSGCLRRLMASF